MLFDEFYSKLKEVDNFEIKEESKDYCIIFNNKINRKYKIQHEAIESSDWENLNSVLNGRDPIILDGITRIVGYYSKISNWNKSKIAELEDRRKGDYRIQ